MKELPLFRCQISGVKDQYPALWSVWSHHKTNVNWTKEKYCTKDSHSTLSSELTIPKVAPSFASRESLSFAVERERTFIRVRSIWMMINRTVMVPQQWRTEPKKLICGVLDFSPGVRKQSIWRWRESMRGKLRRGRQLEQIALAPVSQSGPWTHKIQWDKYVNRRLRVDRYGHLRMIMCSEVFPVILEFFAQPRTFTKSWLLIPISFAN